MIQNIVIGQPLVHPKKLVASDDNDWEENEKANTLFTETRFLPTIMKDIGMVKSISEVKRNKPELMIELYQLDCFWVKWGKQRLYVIVGE